jgi:hypothetical protein
MAVGLISGNMLSSNLTRGTVDLAFDTDTLYLDVNNNRVGVGTSSPSSALHVLAAGTSTAQISSSSTYAELLLVAGDTGDVTWGAYSGFPSAGDFTIREIGVDNWLTIAKTTGALSIGSTETYTPTWTTSGTAPAIGNGTITGRYYTINGLTTVSITVLMGSTTTYGTGDFRFSTPTTGKATTTPCGTGTAYMNNTGTDSAQGTAWVLSGGTYAIISLNHGTTTGSDTVTATVPFTFADTDHITLNFTYEEA